MTYIVSLNKKDKEKLERALTWIKSQIDYTPSLETCIAEEIVISCIDIKPSITSRLKHQLIYSSLVTWFHEINKENTLKSFDKVLQTRKDELLEQSYRYKLLSFINTSLDDIKTFDNIIISETAIRVLDWSEVYQFDLGNLQYYVWSRLKNSKLVSYMETDRKSRFVFNESKYTPLLVEMNANSTHSFINTATDKLMLFRLALNMETLQATMVFGRNPDYCLSSFLPSPVYCILNEENKIIDMPYRNRIQYPYKQSTIKHKHQDIKSFINKINKLPNNDFSQFIVDLLIKYQDSLDLTHNDSIYLSLWRILEAVVLDDPSAKNVNSRLVMLLNLHNENMYKDIISILTEERNSLVHSGNVNGDFNNSIVILKSIVKDSIDELINLSRYIKSKNDLLSYYKYKDQGDTALIDTLSKK